MKSITATFALCLVSGSALAQPDLRTEEHANSVPITSEYINRLVDEARTNSPALKAAASRVRSASLSAESIKTWEDPSALFGGSVYGPKGFKPSEDGDLAYGLEQKLPLWRRPTLTRRVAEAETDMRKAQADYQARQVRSDIMKALLRAALAQQVVQIGEQDLAWIKATETSTDHKYRAGQAALADTLQIQNELSRRADTLRTDRLRLAHENFSLNRLLNRPADSPWPSFTLPPIAPAIPLSEKLLSLALQNEPRLKVLEQEIKQASANAELTRKNRLPDMSLGVEGRQYSGDGEFRSGMFSVRFSLPWFNGGKYRKEYESNKERETAAQEERQDQALMVREELHHLSVDIEAARRQALLNGEEITTRSSQALSSRVSDWETGHGALRDVLDARRMLLESELMAAQANADEHQALADMLLWTGLDSEEQLLPLSHEPPLLPDHAHE